MCAPSPIFADFATTALGWIPGENATGAENNSIALAKSWYGFFDRRAARGGKLGPRSMTTLSSTNTAEASVLASSRKYLEFDRNVTSPACALSIRATP